MTDPEKDFPHGPPEKILAARLIALDEKLRIQLLSVSTEEEAYSLRLEHFTETIRAWMDGS